MATTGAERTLRYSAGTRVRFPCYGNATGLGACRIHWVYGAEFAQAMRRSTRAAVFRTRCAAMPS